MAMLYSVRKGGISGAVWESKYGPQPSIKKCKRDKKGNYEKDEDGKQVYTDYYNQNDLWDIVYVATRLHDALVDHPEWKEKKDDGPKC